MTITKGLGWRPSRPHMEDEKYRFHNALKAELAGEFPALQRPQKGEVDKIPVLDQGQSSGCTGYGTAPHAAVERNVSIRSATFIYAEARKKIGELDLDNGAYGRDAVAVASTLGVPRADYWPHLLSPDSQLPPNLLADPERDPKAKMIDADALKRKAFTYHPLATRQEFRSCLLRHTFCTGITCYSNLFDPLVERFGIIPPPAGSDEGGHWLWFIGADFNFRESEWAKWARDGGYPESLVPNEVYMFQNSWGPAWGRKGRGVIPASYLENQNLTGDGQTLRGFADENK
jgi:hypothetical protein